MKRLSLYVCCFFIFFTGKAQSDSVYQTLITKAELLHLQKNYKDAIVLYEKAFQIHSPDALTSYKAAGVYSLNGNADRAFQYLQLSLSSGWTESNTLLSDPYFEFLRTTQSQKWMAFRQQVSVKERQYEQTLKLSSLRKEINLMAMSDQQLRYRKIHAKSDRERQAVDHQIAKTDSLNMYRTKEIIKQHGWPKISEVGKDGQNNLWLIVQHADQDVRFQQTALVAMSKLVGTKEINLENYAFLYDRVQCNLNYKQLYGTQVVWTTNGNASAFRPILKEDMIDERRNEMGLQPLRIYAFTYGFVYHHVTPYQATKNDSIYQAHVQRLIDSAKYFYAKKEYQKTYDFYNTASTFLGGMSNEDNFDAAIIFSRIASVNNEDKYKSIALDFLDLLALRDNLTKPKLTEEPALLILSKEPRWIELNKHLN
jgi:hypothetical protein